MSRYGWLLFVTLCLIWGLPYLFIRIVVHEMDPATLVFARTAPAALLLAPLAVRAGGLRRLLAAWRWILAFCLLELAVPWLLLFRAEQRISSSLAGLLVASVPLFGALIFPFFDRNERVDAARLIGLVAGFAGVAAVVGLDLGRTSGSAVLEMFGVIIGYTLAPLVVGRRLGGLPSIGVITAALGACAVLYAPWGLTHLPTHLSWQAVAGVVVLTVVCTALAFVIFFALVVEVGPGRSTVVTYANTLVAVLLGVVLLDEPLTIGIAAGLPLIIAGSLLATRRPSRAAQPRPASETGAQTERIVSPSP